MYVTELGEVVNDMMKEAFPTIVDVNFTANLEALLDGVEEGKVNWKTIIANFYPDLDEAVNNAQQALSKVEIADEVSEEVCDNCGRNMVVKYGPHGKFLACPGFPDCRSTKPYFEKIGVNCPKCGKWNRAGMPHCIYCGENLPEKPYDDNGYLPWQLEMKDQERQKILWMYQYSGM